MTDKIAEAVAAGMVVVPREPDGQMWAAGRSKFQEYANRIDDQHTHEGVSAIMDIAPAQIYRAMISASEEASV